MHPIKSNFCNAQTFFQSLRTISCEQLNQCVMEANPYYKEEFKGSLHGETHSKPKECLRCGKILHFAIHGFVFGYFALSALCPGKTVPLISAPSHRLYSTMDGMQLVIDGLVPQKWIYLHAACGMALPLLALAQQGLISRVRPIGEKASDFSSAPGIYGIIGTKSIISLAGMAALGISLRHLSPLVSHGGHNIAYFVLFALPLIPASPVLCAAAVKKQTVPHAVFGHVALKAALSVPMTRLITAAIQRVKGVYVKSAEVSQRLGTANAIEATSGAMSRTYFQGIMASILIMGTWTLFDTVKLIQAIRSKMHGGPPVLPGQKAAPPVSSSSKHAAPSKAHSPPSQPPARGHIHSSTRAPESQVQPIVKEEPVREKESVHPVSHPEPALSKTIPESPMKSPESATKKTAMKTAKSPKSFTEEVQATSPKAFASSAPQQPAPPTASPLGKAPSPTKQKKPSAVSGPELPSNTFISESHSSQPNNETLTEAGTKAKIDAPASVAKASEGKKKEKKPK